MAANKKHTFDDGMGSVLKALDKASGTSLLEVSDGVLVTSHDYTMALRFPRRASRPSTYYSMGKNGSQNTDLKEFELVEVRFESVEKLAVLAGLEEAHSQSHGFIDGSDLLVVSPDMTYLTPLHIPEFKEMAGGHRAKLSGEHLRAIGHMAQLAIDLEIPFSIHYGLPDGETLTMDFKLSGNITEWDEEFFVARLEMPFVVAPWLDYTSPLRTLMGNPSVVVTAHKGSLRLALAKARKLGTDDYKGLSELIFDGGTLALRPLVRDSSFTHYDNGAPIPVKLVSYSGSSEPRYQFIRNRMLKAALLMFNDETASVSTGELIGDPFVLWDGDSRMALPTAKRI